MKRMLITGTSSGIGKALCEYFSDDYEIIRVSRSQGEFVGELASAEFRKKILAEARPQIVINNAAMYPTKQSQYESYQTNLIAALELSGEFSQMAGVEKIINISSVSPAYLSWNLKWNELHYKVQKFALRKFSEYYSLSELRKAQMTTLELGFVNTDFADVRARAEKNSDVFKIGMAKPMEIERVCETVKWILRLPNDVAVELIRLIPTLSEPKT